MRHLDDGVLRRLLDEPQAASSSVAQHYESCDECRRRAKEIGNDARSVGDVLRREFGRADAATAYERFSDRVASGTAHIRGPNVVERVADFYRWGGRRVVAPIAATLAAAAVLLLFVFTPVGTVAQNFLTIFEPRQFVAIGVSKGELDVLPDLKSFGTMVQHGEAAHREVGSAAQAAALTGVRVRLPAWVPPNLPREVHYGIGARASASFTFSAAKARAYAAGAGRPMPAMPRGLDGSVLTLQVGPMVIIGYGQIPQSVKTRSHLKGSEDEHDLRDLPPLVIIESVSPRVSSSGATAREIEAYLLQMPGVAPQLADEIRAIGDPSTTMPIPVPIDKAYSQDVSIDGTSGLAIGDDTGVGGVIVWQKNGIVYGVGGAQPQRQLMAVAQSLR